MRNWKTGLVLLLLIVAAGCRIEDTEALDRDTIARLRGLNIPPEFARGENLFNARCSMCHGFIALGTRRGPPLVHPVYAPGHHADEAFQTAVRAGVRAHHWRFGNMPSVPGLSREEVGEIVRYVRWLQSEAGID
jgi:mono/diheme cytochrome c family protein